MRNTLNLVLVSLLAAWQAPAIAAPLQGTTVHLVGEFTGSEKVRKSVSGIACAPAVGDTRQCLVALDEKLSAQWATLTLGSELTLTVGEPIKLFKKNAVKPEALPATNCPKGLDDDADEADSEGVAFAGDTFFVTGSHGCGRNSGSYRTSTFIDVKVDLSGAEDSIETSIRLNPALAAMFGSDYGADIVAGKGVSIEGIAADKTTLYFGLRSPVTANGTAHIVAVRADDLFGSSPASATAIDVPFGENAGIRDLTILDETGPVLLILSGPVAGEGSSAAIWAFDVAAKTLDKLVDIAPAPGGKPEGLVLAEQSGGELQVLVLHDSLIDGAPTEFRLPTPERPN